MKLPNTTTRLSKTAVTMLKRKDESMNNKTTSKLTRSTILGKAKFAVVAAATALSLAVVDADAQNVNIQNPNAIAGQVSWSSSANNWVFTAGNNSIIEFGAFNIYHGGSVQFIQPGANSAVLNRIVGADPSTINGGLSSNGRLFFVNPAGITFGANAVLNVAQIYAAAGSISNSDFLGGNYRFTNLDGTVKNLGRINASSGVALMGQHVVNQGQIYAPGGFITLAAADKVILAPDGSGIIVQIDRTTSSGTSQAGIENTGLLKATGGHVTAATGDLYSLAMDISGTIVAKDIHLQGGDDGIVKVSGNLNANGSSNGSNKGGKIVVEGEKVWLANGARLNATGKRGGGEILVGGDFQGKNNDVRNAWRTHVDSNVVLNASATQRGHGGKIIIWSDDFTNFFGTIKAKGAGRKGKGGFAEVSGKRTLGFAGNVNLRGSKGGNNGTLLLDPTDITITNASQGAGIVESGGDPNTFSEGGANAAADVSLANINTALAAANVIITTASANAGNGDITWNATNPIVGGAGNSLTLNADGDILINAAIDFGTWTGDFNMNAVNNITISQVLDRTGAVGNISMLADSDAAGGGTVFINAAINIGSGNLQIDGDTVSIGSTLTAGIVGIDARVGSLTITAGSNIVADGAVTLTGNTGITTSANITTSGDSVDFNSDVTLGANVSIDTNGGTGTIDFEGIAGAGFNLALLSDDQAITVAGAATDIGTLTLQDATATGAVTFEDNLVANTLTTFAGAYNLSLLGDTTDIINATTFLNTGNLILGDGGDTLTFVGGVDATAGNAISVGGTVNTTGTAMDFGDISLNAASTFDTDNAALGTMVIGAVTTAGNQLTLDSGSTAGATMGIGAIDDATGDVIIRDAGGLATIASVGGGAGILQVLDSQAGVTFTGVVDVATVGILATTGTIEFSNNLTATNLVTTGDAFNLRLLGGTTTITNATTFLNTGNLILGDGGDTLTFNGGVVATAPTSINVNGNVVTSGDAMELGNLTLDGTSSFDTGNAAAGTMLLGNIATTGFQLTLDSGSTAGATMGIGAIDDATGDVIIRDAGGLATIASVGGGAGILQVLDSQAGVTFTGVVNVGTVDLVATTGTIEFSNNLTAATLTTTGDAFNLSLLGGTTTITNATTFLNTGNLILGDGGDTLTFVGGVDATAGNAISVGGTVNTTGTAMDFGDISLNAASTFDTDNAALGTMLLGNIATTGFQLTLDSGSTDATMDIGAIDDATGGVIIRDAGGLATIASVGGGVGILQVLDSQAGVTFTGVVNVGTVDLVATTGTIEFSNNLTAATLTTTGDAFNVRMLGDTTTITDVVDFANTGFVTFGDGGDTLTFTDGLTRSGNGLVNIGGTVQSTNSDIHFGTGAATLTSDSVVNSSGGTITFGGTLDGDAGGENLTLTAGTGDIDFDDVVGTTRLGDVLVNSVASMTADLAFNAASFTQTAGSVATTFTGALDVTNAVTITNGNDVTFSSTVNATEISQVTGSGTTTFNGAVTTSGANGVDVTTSTITVNDTVTTTIGGIVLNADATGGGAGLLTIAVNANFSADDAVTLTGENGIQTGGDIVTTDDDITFNSATTLLGGIDIDTTGTAAGNILFGDDATINGATFSLDLDAGSFGNIDLRRDLINGGAFTVRNGAVQLYQGIQATSVDVQDIRVSAEFDGIVNTSGAAGTGNNGGTIDMASAGGGSITFTANSGMNSEGATNAGAGGVGGDIDITGTGGVTFADDILITSSGGAATGAANNGGNGGAIIIQANNASTITIGNNVIITAEGGASALATGGDAANNGGGFPYTIQIGTVGSTTAIVVGENILMSAAGGAVGGTTGTIFYGGTIALDGESDYIGDTTFGGEVTLLNDSEIRVDGLLTFEEFVDGDGNDLLLSVSDIDIQAIFIDIPLFTLTGFAGTEGIGLGDAFGGTFTNNINVSTQEIVFLENGGGGIGELQVGVKDFDVMNPLWALWEGDAAVATSEEIPFDLSVEQVDASDADIYWGTWDSGTGAGNIFVAGDVRIDGSGGSLWLAGLNTAVSWSIDDSIVVNSGPADEGATIRSNGGAGAGAIDIFGDHSISSFGADNNLVIEASDDNTITITDVTFDATEGSSIENLTIQSKDSGGVTIDLNNLDGTITGGLVVQSDAAGSINLNTTGGDFTANLGMEFRDALVLDGTTDLRSDGLAGSDIFFDGAITGAEVLTLNTGALGSTTFSGDVAINDLTVSGATIIDGARVITIANAAIFNGTIGGGNLTLSGATVNFNGNVAALESIDVTGTTTIAADVDFDTVGDITFNSGVTIVGASELTTGVDGGITFVSTLGGAAAVVTLASGTGGVSFSDTVNINSLDVTGTATINDTNLTTSADMDFNDAVIVTGSTVLIGDNITMDATVTGDGVGTLTADAGTNLTIDELTSNFASTDLTGTTVATIFDVTGSGDISITGLTINLDGSDYTSTAGSVDFVGAVVLANDTVSITSGGGLGNDITFSSTINADDSQANDRALTLDAGDDGNISVADAVGGNQSLAALTIMNSASTTFDAAVTVTDGTGEIEIADTDTGSVIFDGFLTALSFTANASDSDYGVEMNAGAAITNASIFDNTGSVTLVDAGADFNFTGGLSINDATVSIEGDVITNNADANFGTGAMTLTGTTTVNTGAGIGDVNFGGTIDGGSALTVDSGAGSVDFRGNVGDAGGGLDSLTVTGETTLHGISLQTGNDIIFNSNVTLDLAAVAVTSNLGNITFGASLNSASGEDLTLSAVAGNIDFEGIVGGAVGVSRLGDVLVLAVNSLTADLDFFAANFEQTAGAVATTFDGALDVTNAVTITNGNDVRFSSTVNATEISQLAGSGTTTFNGAVTTDGGNGVSVVTNAIEVNNTITTTNGGLVTLTADTNDLDILAAGDITADGAVTLSAAGTINTAGDITTTDDIVTFANNSTTNLTGTVAIDTVGIDTGGDIVFTGDVVGVAEADLILDAGTDGAITAGNITLDLAQGQLTITNAASLAVTGNISANDLITTDGTATTVSLTGSTNQFTADVDFLNSGNVILGDGGGDTFLFTGGLAFTGGATNNLDSAITSTNTDVNLGIGGTTLDGNTSIDTGAGAGTITFGGTLGGGGENLTLAAGIGDIDFDGVVGAGATRLGDVVVENVASMTADFAFDAASFTQTAGSVATTFTGALNTTGAVTITDGVDVTFDSTVDATTVSQADGSGTTTFNGAVTTSVAGGVNIITSTILLNNSIDANNGVVSLNADVVNLTITEFGDITADGIVNLTGATGINTAGDVTTSGFDVTYTGATVLTGNVAVDTGAADGTITFFDTLDDDGDGNNLTLTAGTGDIDFDDVVGTTRLGDVLVNSVASMTADLAFNAASFTQTAGSVATTFTGALNTTGAVTITDGVDVTFDSAVDATTVSQADGSGTTTFNGAVTTSVAGGVNIITSTILLNNSIDANNGVVSLNADVVNLTITEFGDITADGIVNLTGATGINTAGDVTTSGFDVTYTGATVLTGNVAVDTGAADGTITFFDTLDDDGDGNNLTLTAGTGDIDFDDVVGTTRLGDVLVNSVASMTADLAFNAASFTQTAGSVATTFTGALNTTGAVTITDGVDVTFDSTVDATTVSQADGSGTTTFNGAVTTSVAGGVNIITSTILLNNSIDANNGVVSLNADVVNLTITEFGDITADGIVNLTGATGISTAGDVTTSGFAVNYNSATTLTGDVAVSSGAGLGTITFGGTLDDDGIGIASSNLTLTAGTGDIDFDDVVGTTRLGDVLVNSVASMTADLAFNAASFTQTAGSVATTFTGALNTTGAVTITDGTNVMFGSTVDATTVSQVTGSGTTTFGGAVTTSGANGVNVTNDAIALNGSIAATNGTVDLVADTAAVTIAAAGDITADGIVNLTGATGISTAGDVTTSGFAVNYNSATTLTGDVAVSSGAGAGTITFATTLDGTVLGTESLTLAAGAGDITFAGAVGGGVAVGDTTVVSAANVTTTAGLTAASLTVDATGTTSLTGDTLANGDIDVVSGVITAFNDVLSASGDISLEADTGALTLAAGTDVATLNGSIDLFGETGISLGANLVTDGNVGTITIDGDITLTDNIVIDTAPVDVAGAGDVTVTGDIDGAFVVIMDIEGDLSITGDVGSAIALTSIAGLMTGDAYVSGTIDSDGDIDLLALGDVTLGGDLTAGGDILITTGAVGTIAFESNVSTVTAEGDIVLSNTAVSATDVPAIATITAENSNGITFDAGDDFIMTAGEKLTAFDIDIQTGRVSGTGRAVLGDLVSLGDIRVTADDIDFISRDSAQVLTSDGTLVWDQGVDVVAAGDFIFSVAPTIIGGSGSVQFSSNNIDPDVNGTLSDWTVRWSPNAVTVNSVTLDSTVLDLRAEGMDHLTVEELGALSGALTPMSQMVPIVQIQYESDDDEFETEEEASQEASQEAAVQGF